MSDHHEYCSGGFGPDDIVISGISGRFPLCNNIEELREALLTQKELLIQTDDRFKRGSEELPFSSVGCISDLDKFDANFFGFTSAFANVADPLQRLLLEISYQAIVDAGYDPICELKGANIGVYTGISNDDAKMIVLGERKFDMSVAPGYLRCMLANRCSYFFDFHGPSYTMDTACSSSCVALNNAVDDIREGRVDAALVNSGELCMTPTMAHIYLKSGILSPTAESNPFDARANGFVRTEGVVAFFVQKASMARRAYATILGSRHKATGFVHEGVYVPSHKEEVMLFRDMLQRTGLTTRDVQFIESHGTGTPVGDPIEIKSLETVYCENREEPLYVGSVKSNLGHSEAAAGQTGVLKALLALDSGIIAPNKKFQTPNPNCEALIKGTIRVVAEPLPLTTPYMIVNSFGFGGSIVQTVLKRNPIEYPREPPAHQTLPRLVLYPATTEEGVLFLFEFVESHPELRDEFFALLNKLSFCPTKLKPFRGYALFQNEHPVIHVKNALREKRREVWFIMTGMGCQWPGMGLEMMQIDVFAESMRKSAAVLRPLGIDLFELLRKDRQHLNTDRSIVPAFVTIAAIQIALVDVLRVLEVQPDGMVGHSTGELICAYADGCCTAEQTILSAYWRGKSIETANLEVGGMAAVGLSWEEAKQKCPKGVQPACNNAEDSVTISGLKEPLEKFVAQLQAENIFARVVNVYGYAFHSEHVWPASHMLRAKLKEVIRDPKPRTQRWISSSYPEEEWDKEDCRLAGPEYFTHNLMSVVRFYNVLHKIPSDAIILEISPHFLLQAILKRSIGSDATYLGLMKRNDDNNLGFFFETLGKLYVEDLNPKIEKLYKPVKFPVPRGTPVISDLIKWDHSQSYKVPKWKPPTTSYLHKFEIDSTDSYLLDHHIDGRPLFPATGYIYLVWQALARKLDKKADETDYIIEDFKILRATILDPAKSVSFEVNIFLADRRFEIVENGALVSTGRVYEVKKMTYCEPPPTVNKESTTFVSGEDIYNELRICGYEYGPAFRNLAEISVTGQEGIVEWNGKWISFLDALLLFFMFSKEKSGFMLPIGALSFRISPSTLLKEVEDNESENGAGLPVNFFADTSICRTVGVEISNLDVDAALQHGKPDNCMFEQYRFVPYITKYSVSEKNPDFERYMIACNKMIDTLQSKTNKNLSHGKFHSERKIDFDVESYIKDSKGENTLLSIFKQLVDIEKDSFTLKKTQDISQKYIQAISKDLVNTLLLDEYSLRLLFDIVFENSFRKLSVLEIQNSSITILPTVQEIMEKYSMIKFRNKSLVCRNESEMDKEKLGDLNIQLFMYPDLLSVAQEKSQGIIISAICTSTMKEARDHIRLLSTAVEEKGFIILLHKARILPPENLLTILSGQIVEVVPSDILESWFQEENLAVVSKLSDDICSSLYLLRHSVEPTSRKAIKLSQDPAWFQDLKSSITQGSETLWIMSEGCPHSGVIGMINCLRNEPGGDRIRCVFIPDKGKEKTPPPPFSFEDTFYADILMKDLVMNVYKEGTWGSFRHSKIDKELPKVEVDHSFVKFKKYGDLSSLNWTESALSYIDFPKEELVHIYYSALNFKDIMLATGKLSLQAVAKLSDIDGSDIGFEFSGRNWSGERIAGLCLGRGLGTASRSLSEFYFPVPLDWSLEEAASFPVVYSTCYYALFLRGHLQPGEKILIHSGTGGVGQAAINIALSMNCEIFTTVGTEAKREYLRKKFPSIKEENIGCSRDTSFEIMIMKRTKGKGVDVVVNSLADDKFQASVRCLGQNGRFLEIGKYDIALDHKLGLKCFIRNISFHAIFVDDILVSKNTSLARQLEHLVMQGLRSGVVKPIDRTVFERHDIEKALRFMAGGTHIGKILIKIREEEKEQVLVPKPLRLPATPVTYFYPHKVYIVVGGLGGFGIEVSKWLLSKGAKKLVLTTRYGARMPYHHFSLERWKQEGFHVTVSTLNVAIKEEAEQLLREVSKIGPVGGIFNSAVVLHDSFLENMNFENFKEVCAPKADATEHLDVLSRCLCPELDHFVCFSSISCGRGNAGQMNYGYANSVMERVCEQRKAAGLPGLAIQWGIIGDVGVVHRHMGDDAMIAGVCAQRVKSCLEILDKSCQLQHPVVCSYVVRDSSSKSGDQGDVLQQLAKVFGLKDPSEFNSVRSFSEMGVDSIIGIEVKHLLETACDCTFTVQEIQDMKIDDIKALMEKMESQKKGGESDILVSTVSAKLPKSFLHPKPVERLNDVQSGLPLFILDVDSGNVEQLRTLAKGLNQPVFALLLTKDAPTTDVSALAAWFLQKMKEIAPNAAHLLAHRSGSVIALEMVLLSPKSAYKIPRLSILDGVSPLLEALNRESKKSDRDLFCDFVSYYIPSARTRIRKVLSTTSTFDQKLRLVADLFAKSSKETVNKTEISDVITSHIRKLRLLEEYEPKGSLNSNLLVIEDSSNLLANDVAEVMKLLTEACTGKISIQRVPDACMFTEDSVQKIISALSVE